MTFNTYCRVGTIPEAESTSASFLTMEVGVVPSLLMTDEMPSFESEMEVMKALASAAVVGTLSVAASIL